MKALTSDDYLEQLQELMPKGPAWPSGEPGWLKNQLRAWADEFARIDGRLVALLDEADPRFTSELLGDYERVSGLPDGCVVSAGVTQSTAERRASLVARLTTRGGQSRAYFIALAAAMGYTITITEFHAHSVDDDVDFPLYGIGWTYVWQVNAALNTVFEATVDDTVDDPIASWSNVALECVIRRYAPAHTLVLFSYS